MQVCSIAVAGIAAVADQLAFLYLLSLRHAKIAQVGVQRFQRAVLVGCMAQLDHVAVTVGISLGALAVPAVCDCNRATLCGVHGGANGCAEIQRPVQAAVIVEPTSCNHMLRQWPPKTYFSILQPHLYPPYLVLFHIHTDK